MYHFQESYIKRIQTLQNENQHSNQPTVFKAKQERFNSVTHAEKLKNRVKHLEEQQSKTNLKIQQQNERTIQIIKKKFETEQQRHQKKLRSQDNRKDLEHLKQKVKSQRIKLENDVRIKQEKLLIEKQNRHRQIKHEDMKNQLQFQNIRSKIYQQNQDRVTAVKGLIQQTKMNIENYWDRKASEYEVNRNYSIEEQAVMKSQQDIASKQLGQKEQVLIEQFKNSLSQQYQSTNQLNSIKNMSTKQFKQKFPEFYEKVINEKGTSKSPRNNQEAAMSLKKQNNIEMNKKLENIYMLKSQKVKK